MTDKTATKNIDDEHVARARHHWSEGDVCLLIERAYHGESWQKVADRLDRSAHACQQKHAGILSGEPLPFDLPAGTRELLYAHRKIVYPERLPAEPDIRKLLGRIYKLKLGTVAMLIKARIISPEDVSKAVEEDELEIIGQIIEKLDKESG